MEPSAARTHAKQGARRASPGYEWMGLNGKSKLYDGRTGDSFNAGRRRRLHLHAEAEPPWSRQDPRPCRRPLLARHPAAAGWQGPVRRPALRRNGSVGARSLRRRLHAAGTPHRQVRRRAGPHAHLRGRSSRATNALEAGTPESFNVLIKEMQSLGLDVRPPAGVQRHGSPTGPRKRHPAGDPNPSI
jgi:DNA-directed RNA polymerase subunit beta